jgi:cytochrome b subunit of formate dehydrogenase
MKPGAHGRLACGACHTGIREVPHEDKLPKVECATCHASAAQAYAKGVHSRALGHGQTDAATCQSCHGDAHLVVKVSDPSSPVAKQKLAQTCGSCHANAEFLARHKIPIAKPVESYTLSVHGRAVAGGNESAPSCSDCHGGHDIVAARDPASPINRSNVPGTCGACHSDVQEIYANSVHGQAVGHGVAGAPVCTDCHGEHAILAPSEPKSLVNPARVSSVTCGRCHGDERLAERYNLAIDKVPAYTDSYHGLAARGGAQTVANCASCHGIHNILPSSDSRSTVHPSHLAQTCGTCHPGAGTRFAIGPVHVQASAATAHPVVRLIHLFYLWVIPLTVGFMLLHNGLDFLAKLVRGTTRHAGGGEVVRMNPQFRIAHGLVMLSFPTLVLTGFALKYPESWWSAFPLRGELHRAAALALLAACLYHAFHLWRVPRDRVILREMMPRLQDAFDLLNTFRYNLGLSRERPLFGKFSYAEKVEYLAFLWGTVVMAVSGFILWFDNFSLRNFPKWVSDAATALHWYEAILATLSILIWHFYMVIFDPDVYPMDTAWLTGRASAEHLKNTRPAYHRALAGSGEEEDPGKKDA